MRLRLGIAVSGVAIAFASVAIGLLIYPAASFTADLLLFPIVVLSVASVGAFLAVRVPANRVGRLLVLSGVLFGAGFLTGAYWLRGAAAPGGTWPGTALAVWLNNVLWIPPIVIVTMGVPLIFPDGRLLSPRWRWLVAALALGTLGATLKPAFMPGPMGESGLQNPFGLPGLEPVLPSFDALSVITALPVFVGAMASVAIRFRRGDVVEREQLKWLIAVTAVAVVAFPIAFTGSLTGAAVAANIAWYVGFLAIAALPIAIGIAILRYRLYDIDRIISRTIGYLIVTGMLAVVFVLAVLIFGAVLAPLFGDSPVAVAASTLIVAALFQPLRRWIQSRVDRRFDRARYDGERTVAAFSQRLRDDVDLDSLRADIQGVVARTVVPSSVTLWMRGDDGET